MKTIAFFSLGMKRFLFGMRVVLVPCFFIGVLLYFPANASTYPGCSSPDIYLTGSNETWAGQTWAGCDESGTFTWEEAKSACKTGYHVPSRDEVSAGTAVKLMESMVVDADYWTIELIEPVPWDSRIWGTYGWRSAAYLSGLQAITKNSSIHVRCLKDTGTSTSSSTDVPFSATGTISATPCIIKSGSGSCTSLITWNANVQKADVLNNAQVWSTGVSGSKEFTVYGSSVYYLILRDTSITDQAKELDKLTLAAQCESGASMAGGMCTKDTSTSPTTAGESITNPLNIDKGIPGGEVTLKVGETIGYSFTKGFDAVEFRDSWGGKFNNTVASGHVDTSSKQLKLTGKAVGKVYVNVRQVMGTQADSISFYLNVIAPSTGSTTTPDTIPDAFTFPSKTGVEPGTFVTSDPVTITGINSPVNVFTVSDPMGFEELSFSVNGGNFTNKDKKVENGQQIVVRFRSPNKSFAERKNCLEIGPKHPNGVTGCFTVTTGEIPTASPGTFGPSQYSVPVGTSVDILEDCASAPTGYTSSSTNIATISGNKITTLTSGTVLITKIGGNCTNSTANLTVTAKIAPKIVSTVSLTGTVLPTSASFAHTIDKDGTGYTFFQTKENENQYGFPTAQVVMDSGESFEMKANIPIVQKIESLTANTNYVYYFIAKDTEGNIQNEVTSINFSTPNPPDTPVFNNSDIVSSDSNSAVKALIMTEIFKEFPIGGVAYLNSVNDGFTVLKEEWQTKYATLNEAYAGLLRSSTQTKAKYDEVIYASTMVNAITNIQKEVTEMINRLNFESEYGSCNSGQGYTDGMGTGFSCSDCQYITPDYLREALPTCTDTQSTTNSGTWIQFSGVFSPRPPNCSSSDDMSSKVGTSCNTSTDKSCVVSMGSSETTYSCSGNGTAFYGKVFDVLGEPLPGVTVTIYSGGPVSFSDSTTTDSSGGYAFQGDTQHHFMWFHKAGYRDMRIGIGFSMGSMGEQPDMAMIKPGPLYVTPATQDLVREGPREVSFKLENFDNNDPDDLADLDICETAIPRNSSSSQNCNWMDYGEYTEQVSRASGFTYPNFPYFAWNFDRSNLTRIRYDQQNLGGQNLLARDLNEIEAMNWSFRRKSSPENVTTATMNLINGEFTWNIDRTVSSGDRQSNPYDKVVSKCSGTPKSGDSCTQGTGDCAVDGTPTGGYTMYRCGLGTSEDVGSLSISPETQVISPVDKNPVDFLIQNAESTDMEACYEVLLNPSVPGFVPENNCGTTGSWEEFTGNDQWKFVTETGGAKKLLGTLNYDENWGIPGLKTVSYFRKISDKSKVVSATLLVGEGGTSAGQVGFCGSDGLSLFNAVISCKDGKEQQTIPASICKPLHYDNPSMWTQVKDSAGKVIKYTRSTDTACTRELVSISPSSISLTPGTTKTITVEGISEDDGTEVCYLVKKHPNPDVIKSTSTCDLDSNWITNWTGEGWTKTENGWTSQITYSEEEWGAKGIEVEMGFRRKSDNDRKSITISTPN